MIAGYFPFGWFHQVLEENWHCLLSTFLKLFFISMVLEEILDKT